MIPSPTASKRKSEGSDDAIKMMDLVEKLTLQLSQRPLHLQRTIQDNLLGRSNKRKRGASLEEDARDGTAKRSHVDIDWDLFKSWPEGLKEEEKAFSEYLKRLNMVNIEQRTMRLFLESTRDTYNNEEEDETDRVYTLDDVQHLEGEAASMKLALSKRREAIEQARMEIEVLTDDLQEFEVLQEDLREAGELSSGIRVLEEELHSLQASRNKADGESNSMAKRANLTREEAEQMANSQLEDIINIQTMTDETLKETEAKKKLLVDESKELEGLKVKQKSAEKVTRELESKGRDAKVEKACKAHLATLSILKSLLGMVSIKAATPTCLEVVYNTQDARARHMHAQVAVLVHFSRSSGRIESYELKSTTGKDIIGQLAPSNSPSRAHLDQAVAANDASLLIQEVLACIESTEAEG